MINEENTNVRIHLILVETALELLPKSFYNIDAIKKQIRKYGNAAKLLDTSLHHSFMKELPNYNKRGRPDILHHFLLDTLGSPCLRQGFVQLYFSNLSGIYHISPEMRCPRDYSRFKGLMVQLLKKGKIPPKEPYLIYRESEDFFEWFEEKFSETSLFIFSKKGEEVDFKEFFNEIFSLDKEIAVFIGGFQKGGFSDKTQQLPGKTIAISHHGFDSWIIVQRLLAIFESKLGLI